MANVSDENDISDKPTTPVVKEGIFQRFTKLFSHKSSKKGDNSDNSVQKKKKLTSTGSGPDSSKKEAIVSSLAPKKELTMPEESSGGQVLVHHQKDRPKPLRNHKNRMTMAPQSSDTKDLSFDKFFPINEISEPSRIKLTKSNDDYVLPLPTSFTDKGITKGTIGTQPSVASVAPRVALLPPFKPIITAPKPALSVPNLLEHIPKKEPSVPNLLEHVPKAEPSSPIKLQKSELSFELNLKEKVVAPPSTENISRMRTVSENIVSPTAPRAMPSIISTFNSTTAKSRPISELISFPASLDNKTPLYSTVSHESMLIKQPLLKKSQTINLGRSPFTKEEKAKLLLEINKRQSDEVNIEYRKSGDSKSNQSNSDQSLVEKDQVSVVMREKTDTSSSSASEVRKSVIEMRKMFEEPKGHHSSTTAVDGKAIPQPRLRLNKVAPIE